MMEIIETKHVREALALAALLMDTPAGIGEIVGETGTGKTMAATAVQRRHGAIRVCAYEGMGRHHLLSEILDQADIKEGASTRWMGRIKEYGLERARQGKRMILIVDEANKLRWMALEALRYLADECDIVVLLVGTELYEQQYVNLKTKPLLLQLGRRIGAKRVRMAHLDKTETYAHVLRPRFGDLDKELATKFWLGCRRGNWGEAIELAEECLRICKANERAALNAEVLEAALSWTANRREIAM